MPVTQTRIYRLIDNSLETYTFDLKMAWIKFYTTTQFYFMYK